MSKIIKSCAAIVLCMSLSTVSFGKTVDENTAKAIGSNLLMSVNVPGVKTVSDLTTAYIATDMVNGSVITDYYVFNVVGAKGFVVVSGDDNVMPILAWSNESTFDITNINPSAAYLMDGYKNQITAVISTNYPAQPGTAEKWSALKSGVKKAAAKTTTVAPMLSTLWDQYGGGSGTTEYNAQCPGTGSNKAVTGCVATCMAQIMKFWNWPTVGCGSHTYTPTYMPLPGYGYTSQTADFGNTAYNWTAMTNTSSSSSVAQLMFHAGVAVDMMYGPISSPSGSGAYVTANNTPLFNNNVPLINCAEYALKTYFHFNRSLQGVSRVDGSGATLVADPAWISMIEAELNAGRPLMYSGQGSDGGHVWVCDGWETGTKTFHFNFGWSGASDAYYSIDNVAPPALGAGGGSTGNNFNSFQSIVIGIQPDSFLSTPGNIQMAAHLDCATGSPMQYLSPFSLTTKIYNAGTTTFNGDFCVQAFDTLNKLVGATDTLTAQTITAAGTTGTLTFNTAGVNGMIPETYYYMRVMYRPNSTTPWAPVANNNTFINYNAIDVRNSQIYSNNQLLEIYQALTVTPSTTIASGSSLTVATQVGNSGTSAFSGTVQAVLTNVATGSQFTIQQHTSQTIEVLVFSLVGGVTPTNYTFTNAHVSVPSGTYVLAIEHQNGGTGTSYVTGSDFYENPVVIKVSGNVGVNTVSSEDKISVYPNPASDVVNVQLQGVSASEIWITDIQGRQIQRLTIAGNQPVITLPVNNYAPGMYFVNIQVGQELVTKKVIIK